MSYNVPVIEGAFKTFEPGYDGVFVYPGYYPENEAIPGVTYDFNHGFRIMQAETSDQHLLVIAIDADTDTILLNQRLVPGKCLVCKKKYYVRYKIFLLDEQSGKTIWTYTLDLKDREVVLQVCHSGAIGDTIGWFSMMERFQKQHNARIHVLMPFWISPLFKDQYPDMVFETEASTRELRPFATYYICFWWGDSPEWQPYDFHGVSLPEQAGRILGLDDLSEIPPRLNLSAPRQIQDRYVVIATHASKHVKCWCNPDGWRLTIAFLRRKGYRVLCIDKEASIGSGDGRHELPCDVEDYTGDKPLQERVNILKDADFFIGLSSGLSWLAWACRIPIVLISGICAPFAEFQTPYRVQNKHVCHGCWNDARYGYDHDDFMWCPRYKDTDRAYECTRGITSSMVIDAIKRIPGTLCSE